MNKGKAKEWVESNRPVNIFLEIDTMLYMTQFWKTTNEGSGTQLFIFLVKNCHDEGNGQLFTRHDVAPDSKFTVQ
jgi:hypothetical protein